MSAWACWKVWRVCSNWRSGAVPVRASRSKRSKSSLAKSTRVCAAFTAACVRANVA